MAVTSQSSGLGLLLPWGAPHFLGAKCGLHVCGRRLRTRCPHMHSGDAKATAGGGKSSPARLPRRAHSPCQATKWRHPGPRPKEAQTVGGRGREAPSPPQPPAGPRKALEGAGAGWGLLLHQAPRAWTGSPALQGRGPRLGREAGEQTGAHLVAQLLGLLLQHGVALLVPAHVLVVAEPLHVFQLLMRNFQLLLVVVMFLNFDFKVLQLLLE